MSLITRRSILGGMVGLLAAPAIVRAGSLMPIRALPMEGSVAWVDFEFDEPLAAAIQYRDEFVRVFEQNANWLRSRTIVNEVTVPFNAIRFLKSENNA